MQEHVCHARQFKLGVKPGKISHCHIQRVSAHLTKSENEPTMTLENYQHSEDLIKQGFEELSLGKVIAFCIAHILYQQLCASCVELRREGSD